MSAEETEGGHRGVNLERQLGNLYATWLTVGVALIGQALWFSWQYGSLAEKVGEHERRLASIEAGGSPALIAVKSQVEIDARRLENIERYVPDQIQKLNTSDAKTGVEVERHRAEIDRLRDWRVIEETQTDHELYSRTSGMEQQLAAQRTMIEQIKAQQDERERVINGMIAQLNSLGGKIDPPK